MVPSPQTNESVEDLPSSPYSLPPLSPESAPSNDNMVPSPCTSKFFQDWPSSLASLKPLSPTPLQDNPRELTPMPSSPFSFESNTPEKSITPVPSQAGFKIMSSMPSLQTTSKKTRTEQQNTLNSFSDGQQNAQNNLFTDLTPDVSPQNNENEETTCTEKDNSRTSFCSTGRATKILKDLKTIKLPKTPPVRGNVRLLKGKENVF